MKEGLVILEWSSSKQKNPILIGSFNQQEVGEAIIQKAIGAFTWGSPEREYLPGFPKGESHFEIIRVEFLERRDYWLALQDFIVFHPPLVSQSKDRGSEAIYYAAQKKEGLLVQYLRKYSKTSSHDHLDRGWIESYNLLAGSAVLDTDEDQYLLEEVSPVIGAEVGHQLRTTNHPALTLITIKGDRDWFEVWKAGQGHRYRPLIPKNA